MSIESHLLPDVFLLIAHVIQLIALMFGITSFSVFTLHALSFVYCLALQSLFLDLNLR